MQTFVQVAEKLAEVVGLGARLGKFPIDDGEGRDVEVRFGGVRD
jgi:hypothetical protein